jgi:hypothetical protein
LTENYFFEQACLLNDPALKNDDTSFISKFGDSDNVLNIVDQYRLAVSSYLKTSCANARITAEVKSRELLVVWIAYCMDYKNMLKKHSLLQKYGVILKWSF